jgi:hypothetical protein
MTSTIVACLTAPAKPQPTKVVVLRGRRPGRPAERTEPASREAQRVAAAILEVLAGVRTPTDAAAVLGIGVPRYYLWEQRAVAGLVAACEPRPVGKTPGFRHQIAVLEKEITRLKQNCARQQALVRAAQRTIGLAPPPMPKSTTKATGKAGDRVAGKKPRKRRPVVRALKAAAALRAAVVTESPVSASVSGVSASEVLQQSDLSSPLSPTTSLHAAGG